MQFHATTILAVRQGGMVAIGGDGQVSLGSKTTQPETDEVPESRSKPPQLIRKIVVHVANVYNEGWILSENRYLEHVPMTPSSRGRFSLGRLFLSRHNDCAIGARRLPLANSSLSQGADHG